MKVKYWYKLIAVAAAAIVGVGVASAVKQWTVLSVESGVSAELLRARDQLAAEEANYKSLRAQNDQLESRKKLLLQSLSEQSMMADAIAEHEKFAMIAGLTNVKGQGVIITLEDKEDYDPLVDSIESVIHDSTINYVINVLWAAGARAISLNEVRLTAVSEINCVGPTILTYGVRQMPPYVISAIGPTGELSAAVRSDSYLARLTKPEVGIRMSIGEEDSVTLPSFSKARDYLRYINLLETP